MDAQIFIGTTLIDTKKLLMRIHSIRQGIQPLVLLNTALQPACGAFHRSFSILIARWILHTFVKCHGNIRTKIALNAHALLRPHKNPAAVYMRGKCHAFLPDLPQLGQGKYLETAAVRQNWAIPPHKFMKSAQRAHSIVARPHMQMVSIR